MKLIYDISEPNLDKKCYFLDENRIKIPVLFWDIKLHTSLEQPRFTRWRTKQEREQYLKILADNKEKEK